MSLQTMKAVGFDQSLPISDPNSLFEFTADYPSAREFDVIVKVSAVSVNPVDTKVRALANNLTEPQIPGYDGVGEVVALGSAVTTLAIGDRVYYAGDFTRPGSNAEYQAVDSRVVAKAPARLTDAEAAALPLTALTGWEALFDRMRVDPTEKGKTLLMIGGAGGVGSITIQLAKQLTHLTVIATASRPETEAWVKDMGADYVANHRDLVNSVKALGFENVDYIFNAADTEGHWEAMVELIKPQGMICSIVETHQPIDLSQLQFKSAGFIWELMFTRPMYQTDDIAEQHAILFQLANLVDSGRIRTTLTHSLHGLSAESIKQAHQQSESGTTIGKLAITF